MRNLNLITFALLLAYSFSRCAGTKVVTVYDSGKIEKGFTFYQSNPYLWVTLDSSGKNYLYKIIYLPDKSKSIHIEPKRGFGSGSTSFKSNDGWQLTEFGSTSDSKMPETLTAIGSIVSPLLSYIKGDSIIAKENSIELIEKTKIKPKSIAGLYKMEMEINGNISFLKCTTYPIINN